MTTYPDNLFNKSDKIMRWPKNPVAKEIIIKFIFDKEVNNIIQIHNLFNNIELLRRELISRKYLARKDDGSQYWKIG